MPPTPPTPPAPRKDPIDAATFDKLTHSWTFTEAQPFWAGFVCDGDQLESRAPAPPAPKPSGGLLGKLLGKGQKPDAPKKGKASKPAAAPGPGGLDDDTQELLRTLQQAGAKSGHFTEEQMKGMMAIWTEGARLSAENATKPDNPPGVADVVFTGARKAGIDPHQRAAYTAYRRNEAALGAAAIDAIFKYYQDRVESEPEWFEHGPKAAKPDDLRFLLQLSSVYIHPADAQGRGDIGLTFHCEWDDEHGIGVRIRDGKVVDVGYSDCADEPEAE